MALPKNRLDLEKEKFEETLDGEVSVRVSKNQRDIDNQLEDSTSIDDLKCILTDILAVLKEKEDNGTKGVISDGTGNKYKAQITARNQLVTAPLGYSEMYPVQATVVDTAFNVIEPKSGKNFIITDAILSTDRGVGVNGAEIVVYEASAPDTLTEDKVIFQGEFQKSVLFPFIGLNMIVTKGKWVNLKTNDNTVSLSIAGYYVDEEG